MMNKALDPYREFFICLSLIVVTLAVFWPVTNHEFINYDDNLFVTENTQVQAGFTMGSLKWAFTTTKTGNWHPLTWLSHMLDVRLFGLKPGLHHGMNLFFHIANSLLLFLVFHRMTKALWQSAFVAALFALHPLHVESVAWVAERKDVLSTFFWMLTMGAYVYYVQRPGLQRYVLVVVFFVLGLMSKPMVVTLPFVLLLMDYWPLKRFQHQESDHGIHTEAFNPSPSVKQKRKSGKQPTVKVKVQKEKPINPNCQWTLSRSLLREKVPFFILTVAASVITYIAQQKEGTVASIQVIPPFVRFTNALVSYVDYIGKMIWPAKLAVFYPNPGLYPPWQVLGAALLLIAVTSAAIWVPRRLPYATVGWLWYLGTMIPVIGIVQVGEQAMADRYTYVPLIGLFVMIAWAIPEFTRTWHYRTSIYAICAGFILSALMYTTSIQLQHWQNSVTLFEHTLKNTSNNYSAHYSMGNALRDNGRIEEAVAHYTEALRINPVHPEIHFNLGNILSRQGKFDEAIMHYMKAIQVSPNDADAYNHLGTAQVSQGKIRDAVITLTRAIEIDPNKSASYNNLGAALVRLGKPDEAVANFTRAVQINPDDMEAHYNIGVISASQGKFDNAAIHFRETTRIKPDFAKTHNNLGSVLVLQGRIEEAIASFREALRIQPDYQLARDNLKNALSRQKRTP
jgi:protein O-mannosyl-transferase